MLWVIIDKIDALINLDKSRKAAFLSIVYTKLVIVGKNQEPVQIGGSQRKQAASSNIPLVFLFITSVNGANGFDQIFIHSENQDNLNVLWSVASQASYSGPLCDFLKSSCSWTFSRTLTFTEFCFFLGKGG